MTLKGTLKIIDDILLYLPIELRKTAKVKNRVPIMIFILS